MANRLESVLSALLTTAALVIAAVLVHREVVSASRPDRGPDRSTEPEFIEEWTDLARHGIRAGRSDAEVQILEFTDLECPYCKNYHHTISDIIERHAPRVSYVFMHYPLPNHRFARPAARAAECADAQQRFMPFIDVVFNKQDSLGLKPWASYAREALVGDTASFVACLTDTLGQARIDAGIASGNSINVRGTPTILVNGWMFPSVPSDSALRHVVDSILASGDRH